MNQEPFDSSFELIGRVLSHIAKSGLRRTDLWLVDLFGGHYPDEYQSLDEHFTDVVLWLRNEGALTYEDLISGSVSESGFIGVQMTSRGIAMLRSSTGSELPKPTIEETIAKSKGDLSPSVYTKIGALFGGLLGGFTKTIS